jgi:ATP-dependent RNA helicase RhlE
LNFNTFLFHPHVAAGIASAGYSTPTPIQAKAIPKIMQGHDLVALAQTGTGKTAAFVLPILHRLVHGQRRRLKAMVIVPTRELAEQIHQAIEILGAKTGIKSIAVYGGVGYQRQVQLLKSAEIVVACPGRLIDHIQRRTVDLSSLEALVLDEADQMFDMGFLPDIRRILKCLPKIKRQTLLFSATMPDQIWHLADEILKNPEKVQVAHDMPADTVSHTFFPVAQHMKTALLLNLLGTEPTDAVLIFTRTKHRARNLGGKLAKLGYRSTSLQGNLSQAQRQEAMNGFKSGKYQVLVATDIAARGIDVANVSHVINFDTPSTPEIYIHRVGRTGRAERNGEAFTLFSDEEMQLVKAIRRTINIPVKERTLEDFDYNSSAPNTCNQRRQLKSRQQSAGNTNRRQNRRAVKGTFAWLSPRKPEMVGAR